MKAFAVLCALFALLLVPSMAEAAAPSIPINVSHAAGVFNGALNITKFDVQNNQLVAIGTLSGTVTNRAGQAIGYIVRTITLPVLRSSSTAGCPILHLELGPLDLNLLGLVVHLDKVVLDITAQPGSLLGDLLCGLAGGDILPDLGAIEDLVDAISDILDQLEDVEAGPKALRKLIAQLAGDLEDGELSPKELRKLVQKISKLL